MAADGRILLSQEATGLGPHTGQQRQFPPLPLAIHMRKADFAQPLDLRFRIQQFVRGVFRFYRESDAMKKFLMQPGGWGGDVLQITKHAACVEQTENFRIERTLSLMHQMVNREARNNCIKRTNLGKRKIHVVLYNANPRIRGEAGPYSSKHRRGEVDSNSFGIRMLPPHQREQPPISRAQIQNAARR